MATEKVLKTSEINFKIHLDEQHIPLKMEWQASDSPNKGLQECKAVLLSIWDGKERTALRIDLWTKEMRIDEMDQFVYQTILTLADSYQRATNNSKGSQDLRDFSKAFGEKAGLFKK